MLLAEYLLSLPGGFPVVDLTLPKLLPFFFRLPVFYASTMRYTAPLDTMGFVGRLLMDRKKLTQVTKVN